MKFIEPLPGSRKKHYQFTAIDDCTRIRVLRIYPRNNQKTAIQFLDYVLEKLPFRVETVQTDNGAEFQGEFTTTISDLDAQHRRIVAGRPQTNGCVERVHETILEECWKPAFARHLLPSIGGLREELRRYLRYYNTDRAHTGRWTRGRTPEQVIGKAKVWAR